MKYLKQVGIILTISFIGEILYRIIPLPIPAGIYGIILLFLALECKVIKLDQVKDVSLFLIEIMPVLFIPSAVGLMTAWGIIKDNWLIYITITVVTTLLVMVVSGWVTQLVLRLKKKGGEDNA
ncbi:MAG: CidA/LrgA family protein [Clostridia bacterium]|nr:CidA/LrgA family protein [Clostridia bacterium]